MGNRAALDKDELGTGSYDVYKCGIVARKGKESSRSWYQEVASSDAPELSKTSFYEKVQRSYEFLNLYTVVGKRHEKTCQKISDLDFSFIYQFQIWVVCQVLFSAWLISAKTGNVQGSKYVTLFLYKLINKYTEWSKERRAYLRKPKLREIFAFWVSREEILVHLAIEGFGCIWFIFNEMWKMKFFLFRICWRCTEYDIQYHSDQAMGLWFTGVVDYCHIASWKSACSWLQGYRRIASVLKCSTIERGIILQWSCVGCLYVSSLFPAVFMCKEKWQCGSYTWRDGRKRKIAM